MTETSHFWDGLITGDATLAPYSASLYSQLWKKLFTGSQPNDGYIEGFLNELVVTGIAGGINVASGAALVNGGFYENTSTKTFTLATPSGSERIDNLILRKHWANQEIRLAVLTGVEGAGVGITPTQSEGVIWEYIIASVSISTAGVITVADTRNKAITTLLGPNAALQHIETVVAVGGGASIDFSDIPQTFRHLIMTGLITSRIEAFVTEIAFMLNGDANLIFNRQTLFVDDSSQNDQAFAEINNENFGQMSAPGGAAGNRPGTFELRIPFYTNENFYKSIHHFNGTIYNDTLNNFIISGESAVWKKVDAINRITIFQTTAGELAGITADSQASLYGTS